MTSANHPHPRPLGMAPAGPPQVWRVGLVWTTKQGDTFTSDSLARFTEKPHTGDARLVLETAIDARDLARGRRSMLVVTDAKGMPSAVNPDDVATIRLEILDPNGVDVESSLEPGWIDDDA